MGILFPAALAAGRELARVVHSWVREKRVRLNESSDVMKQQMVELASARTPHANTLFSGLLGVLAVGIGPSGCLSDVTIPDCYTQKCAITDGGSSDAAGKSGAAGEITTKNAGGASGHAGSGSLPAAGEGGAASGGNLSGTGGSGNASGARPGGGADTGGGADAGGGAGVGGGAGAGAGVLSLSDCVDCTAHSPCTGQPYATTLTVSGGTPPYRWVSASLSGWKITLDPGNSSRATLTHDAATSTELTLQVTDTEGKQGTKTYLVRSRNSCWFAYTALDASGGTLKLLDPLSEPPSPLPLLHNQGVYDFQFSPNGQSLVYRYDADSSHPKGKHLALLDLATRHEQSLSFSEDAVTAFAWSPDSTRIATAFTSGGATFLGGVRLGAAGANDVPLELTRVIAPVQSELYWVGERFVAFHAELLPDLANPGQFFAENPYHQRTPFYASVDAGGFGAAQAIVDVSYDPGFSVQATPDGFFVITGVDPSVSFNEPSSAGSIVVAHDQANLISPSGKYSAKLNGDQLQVFLADEMAEPAASSKVGEGCPRILAWAQGRERIACVADVPNGATGTTHGEVRIFDIDPNSDTLAMSTVQGFCEDDSNASISAGSCSVLQNKYGYGEDRAVGRARGFSPDGQTFAFTTTSKDINGDNYLYWVDLSREPITLTRKQYFFSSATTTTSPVRVAYSPNGKMLLLQRGNQLTAQDLAQTSADAAPATLSVALATGAACSEDFASGSDQFCGNTDRTAPLAWSPDSRAAAYRTPGTLTVVDFNQFPTTVSYSLPAPECKESCSGQFAFQPVKIP